MKKTLLIACCFCTFLYFAQTAEQLHDLVKSEKYPELIIALDKGADPASLVFEGGGFYMGRRTGSQGEDLMSRLLQMPVTAGRNLAIEKLMEKKVVLSTIVLHNYSAQFASDPANKTNTKLADYLAQNDPGANSAMTYALKNRFDYFLKLLEKKYTFSRNKDALASAAYESDSTEFLKELIQKFGVYPKQKTGLHPALITQTALRKNSPAASVDSTIILFVKAGATFEEPINFKEKYIHWLAQCRDSILLKAVGKHAPFVFKQRDENGRSLVHLLVISKNPKFLSHITPYFKELGGQDKFKKTALDYVDKNDLRTRKLLFDHFSPEEKKANSFFEYCDKPSLSTSEISAMTRLVEECSKEAWFTSTEKDKANALSFFLLAKNNDNAEAMALLAENEIIWEKMSLLFDRWVKDDKYELVTRSMPHNIKLIKKITWVIDNENSRDFKPEEKNLYISALCKSVDSDEMRVFKWQQFEEFSPVITSDSCYIVFVEKNGKKGLMTLGGKTLAEPIYDEFGKGKKLYYFKTKAATGYEYEVIDDYYRKVAKISSAENMRTPEIMVWKKNYFLVFDSDKGKQIYDNTYGEYERVKVEGIQDFKRLDNNYIAIKKNDKWGIWYYMNSVDDVRYKFDDLKATEENPQEEIEYQVGKKRRKAMMNDIVDLLLR